MGEQATAKASAVERSVNKQTPLWHPLLALALTNSAAKTGYVEPLGIFVARTAREA